MACPDWALESFLTWIVQGKEDGYPLATADDYDKQIVRGVRDDYVASLFCESFPAPGSHPCNIVGLARCKWDKALRKSDRLQIVFDAAIAMSIVQYKKQYFYGKNGFEFYIYKPNLI